MPKYGTAVEQLAHAPLPAGLYPTEDERQAITAYWREQETERPSFVDVLDIYVEACSEGLPAGTRERLQVHVWYVLCILYGFMQAAIRRPGLAKWWKYNPADNARLWLRFAAALDMTSEQLETQVLRRYRELGA